MIGKASPLNQHKKQDRMLRVSELYIKGKTQYAIADELGVCQGTVSLDLKDMRALWLEQRSGNINEVKMGELAKIDAVECNAWKSWEASTNGKLPDGDPKFLKVILDCISERCKLTGLYAPEKKEIIDPRDDAADLKRLTEQQLRVLASIGTADERTNGN